MFPQHTPRWGVILVLLLLIQPFFALETTYKSLRDASPFPSEETKDVLLYLHTSNDCNLNHNLFALSSLDALLNGLSHFTSKHNNTEKLFLPSSGLQISQVNCLESEWAGSVCDVVLGSDQWRRASKEELCGIEDIPTFFELSMGLKTAMTEQRKKALVSMFLKRLRFVPSQSRTDEYKPVSISRQSIIVNEDASQETRGEIVSTALGQTIPFNEELDELDNVLNFLSLKYQFNDEQVTNDFTKRYLPRPYMFYEECNFAELFSQNVTSNKIRPANFFLIHKGPSHFEFPKRVIEEYNQVSRALLNEQVYGLVYLCAGEAIKMFETSRDINGKGNFGTILTYQFIYGKRQSEIMDRATLMFYNPIIKGKSQSSELSLFEAEPYDSQLVQADAEVIMKQVNLMLKNNRGLNNYADENDPNFFMQRGLFSVNEVLSDAVRQWLIKKPHQGGDILTIEKHIKPFMLELEKILAYANKLRQDKELSKETSLQYPDDDIDYSDKMIDLCDIAISVFKDMIANFELLPEVRKQTVN